MHSFEEWIGGSRQGALAMGIRGLLWLASYPYGLAISLRNRAFDLGWFKTHAGPLPVLSIGNLTVGGTGKTPAVAFLARWFRNKGVRVAIVSRGYGALAEDRNDEAKELEEHLPDVPHLQNPNRLEAVNVACEELESQLVLLDDGFQHRRLKRDLNILMLDAIEPFGYGYLLPRGLLREPIGSLRRVDVIIVSRADQVPVQRLAELRTQIQRHAPKAAWVEAEHRPLQLRNVDGQTRSLDSLQGGKAIAFCGLGNPRGFLRTLEQCGTTVVDSLIFPDHHPFHAADIERLHGMRVKQGEVDFFLCTGKDLPKIGLSAIQGTPLWALDIELAIRAGLEPLEERLQQILEQVQERELNARQTA